MTLGRLLVIAAIITLIIATAHEATDRIARLR